MTQMNTIGKDALRAISGAKQRGKIKSWLTSTGIPYLLDSNGWPVVAESAVSAKLGGTVKSEPRLNFS